MRAMSSGLWRSDGNVRRTTASRSRCTIRYRGRGGSGSIARGMLRSP